jgi:hypothetical protein
MALTVAFTSNLVFNSNSYAWHENLGIDANKAAELYQTKPNDPAIVQWKNALQMKINNMDPCFEDSIVRCESYMSIIISHCNSHPNELLACNDTRLAGYPSLLNYTKVAEQKDKEARQKAYEVQQKEWEAKQKAQEAEAEKKAWCYVCLD